MKAKGIGTDAFCCIYIVINEENYRIVWRIQMFSLFLQRLSLEWLVLRWNLKER